MHPLAAFLWQESPLYLDLRRKRCQISRIFEAKRKAAFFSAPYGMARQPFQS